MNKEDLENYINSFPLHNREFMLHYIKLAFIHEDPAAIVDQWKSLIFGQTNPEDQKLILAILFYLKPTE